MPEQISIFELVANASLLVQLVMAMLALASIVSWMMIFQRWFFPASGGRRGGPV